MSASSAPTTRPAVYLESLGCRLNLSEIEALARRFAQLGFSVVRDPRQAQLCIVNTCAVTASAERKTRRLLRALHRSNPAARIAAIGCATTLNGKRLERLPGVEWALSNEEKERTVEIVTGDGLPGDRGAKANSGIERPPRLRTRAFVKVQDGCDNHCTYCIVSRLRGAARSRPLPEVVTEVQNLAGAGVREAVLTGVNLGSYGRDLGIERGLAELLRVLLAETDLPRLRLSSVEPWDVDESFFALWADSRLCRQLHLPLQSGCDQILRRMGRRITSGQYRELVRDARATIPDLALTTDVIVGFPGEDEAAFERSLAFIERIRPARLHVFPFSPRPGTPASALGAPVPLPVRRERARRMRQLGLRLANRFQAAFVGREMAVLWERRRRNGLWPGWTDNYLRVVTRCPADLHNRIVPARLVSNRDRWFIGEIVS